jgi:hypothetical protein
MGGQARVVFGFHGRHCRRQLCYITVSRAGPARQESKIPALGSEECKSVRPGKRELR